MIVWEFDWADSALVVSYEWLSYRGGRLSRFDCTVLEWNRLNKSRLQSKTIMSFRNSLLKIGQSTP